MPEVRQPAAARWSVVVREFEASGLTLREFAQRRDVNASTLGWWRARLRHYPHEAEPARPAAFVEVTLPVPVRPKPPLRVRVDGRPWFVEVPDDADHDGVRRLLEALC